MGPVYPIAGCMGIPMGIFFALLEKFNLNMLVHNGLFDIFSVNLLDMFTEKHLRV